MANNVRGPPRLARLIVVSVFLVSIAFPLVAVTAAAEEPPVFVLKWSTSGTSDGDGRFYEPVGVAVDSAGNVYVADTGDDRECAGRVK